MSDSGSQPRAVSTGDQGGRVADDTAAALRAIQRLIISDERPDTRYINKTSNRQKVVAICKLRGVALERFDIGDAPPYDDWMRRFDRDAAAAGMYVADLRNQYFTKIKARLSGASAETIQTIDQIIADSEFWYAKFADVLYTMSTGEAPPKRVLH